MKQQTVLQGLAISVTFTLGSAAHMAERRFANWTKHFTGVKPDAAFMHAVRHNTFYLEPFRFLAEVNLPGSHTPLHVVREIENGPGVADAKSSDDNV